MSRAEPRIWHGHSVKDGGCNFCNRHDGPNGETAHPVLLVQGEGCQLQVRFCLDCAKHFQRHVAWGRR